MWIRNPQHDQMIRQKVLPINYLGRSVAHVDVSISRIHTGDNCVGLKEMSSVFDWHLPSLERTMRKIEFPESKQAIHQILSYVQK